MKRKSQNINNRRQVALDNLRKAKFFEKGNRTQESWQKRVDAEIATLEKRIR